MESNDGKDPSFLEFISNLLNNIPKRTKGFFSTVILITIIIIVPLYLFKDNITKYYATKTSQTEYNKSECDSYIITGKIIDIYTKKSFAILKVNLEDNNLNPDFTVNDGIFSIIGTRLNSTKIVAFQITLIDNTIINTQDIDLSNSTKYRVNGCVIDIGSIMVNSGNSSIITNRKRKLVKSRNKKIFIICPVNIQI